MVPDEKAAEARYRMLETIRQYGREKLAAANESERTASRHIAFFAEQAEAFEPHFYHPDKELLWYARADVELDNFRAALDHSLAPARVRTGMRVVLGLHRYWVARVYRREANEWFKHLLAVQVEGEPTPLRARAIFVAGHITNYFDPAQANVLGKRACAFRECSTTRKVSSTHCG